MILVPNALSAEDKAGLRQLAYTLRRIGLVDLLAAYGFDSVRTRTLRIEDSLLPSAVRTAVALFVLGDTVNEDEARRVLPPSIVEMMQRLDLLTVSSEGLVSMSGLRLVLHHGVIIICQQPSVSAKLYYGPDSLALGRFLHSNSVHGVTLDVCSGVGTQAILSAKMAERTIAVDIQQDVVPLFWINGELNGVADRLELRIGDGVEDVGDEMFDHICCNPPLLPVPPGVPYPLVGNGGADGMAVIRRLLYELPRLLKKQGRFHAVGTVLGSEQGPDLTEFQAISAEMRLDLFIIFPWRGLLSIGEPLLEALVSTAAAYGERNSDDIRLAYIDPAWRQGRSHLYTFILSASVTPVGMMSQLETTRHYETGIELWLL